MSLVEISIRVGYRPVAIGGATGICAEWAAAPARSSPTPYNNGGSSSSNIVVALLVAVCWWLGRQASLAQCMGRPWPLCDGQSVRQSRTKTSCTPWSTCNHNAATQKVNTNSAHSHCRDHRAVTPSNSAVHQPAAVCWRRHAKVTGGVKWRQTRPSRMRLNPMSLNLAYINVKRSNQIINDVFNADSIQS